MKPAESVFVDSGAWIALAEQADPLHERAREQWDLLVRTRARLVTSTPVMIETFTFLDRRASREAALRWRASLNLTPRLRILGCSPTNLAAAWAYFDRKDLHKLSLVDATSFVLMRAHGIRVAFAFDTHFAVEGFRFVA